MTAIHPTLLGAEVGAAMADLYASVAPSVVLVNHRRGNGAGIIWTAEGDIITNNHVVPHDRAEVLLRDGRKFVGMVATRNPERDLAVIKIVSDEPFTPATIGDADSLRPGHLVFAIGHPRGKRDAITMGVVVGVGESLGDRPRQSDIIQADVPLAPGNSGGPMVDALGRVVGINAMVAGRMSYAIPARYAEILVSTGIAAVPGDPGFDAVRTELRHPVRQVGYVVMALDPDGPAERAGLLIGDTLVTIDALPVPEDHSIFRRWLGSLQAGEALALGIVRAGAMTAVELTPETLVDHS